MGHGARLVTWGVGVYLGQRSLGSAYGAAGSLVVLLVWVYYAAVIFLFGAEITQVVARRARSGTEPAPAEHATRTRDATRAANPS